MTAAAAGGLVLFGLTGGVASGKSTVAQRFQQRGVPVIDADAVAREVVAPGTAGLAEVARAFGQGVLRGDGTLDRPRLGELVFAEPTARQRLNDLLHPRIRARTQEHADLLERQGERLACYDAALLVENGLVESYRPLVVATLSAELQLERLMQRDGLAKEPARGRISAQLPLADKMAVADVLVDTGGTVEQTQRRADEALAAVRAHIAEGRLG
jgi:dephospho-CoA kinase